MKNLKDILVEKLKVDDIKLTGEFPIDKDTATIVNFLKDNNFEEVLHSTNDVWRDVHEKFDKNRGNKVFEYWPKTRVLRFADMTKDISDKNPIFVLSDDFQCIEPKLHNTATNNIDMQEFLTLIKKVFGWK